MYRVIEWVVLIPAINELDKTTKYSRAVKKINVFFFVLLDILTPIFEDNE